MASKRKVYSTDFPGVRYREHAERRHGKGLDRYYSIRYYLRNKDREEGLGWSSEGWNAKKASLLLSELRRNHLTGEGAQSLAEMRANHDAQRQAEEAARRSLHVQGITLERFLLAHYMPWAKREKRSWRSDEIRIIRHIIPQLGAMPLRALARQDVERFRDSLRTGGLAEATVLQYLAILRRAYNLAGQTSVEGVVLFDGVSPVKGVKLPKPKNDRIRFLSYSEADALLASAQARGWTDLHDAMALSLNTGMRRGEILRMEAQDVDLDHMLAHVRDEDRRKPGGVVYLNEVSGEIMRRRLEAIRPADPRLFSPPRGGAHRRNLSSLFGELVDSLGWNANITDRRQRICFHTLRHTFASWLALAGVDIYRIQKLLRQKTLVMAQRYAKLNPEAERAALHRLRPSLAGEADQDEPQA